MTPDELERLAQHVARGDHYLDQMNYYVRQNKRLVEAVRTHIEFTRKNAIELMNSPHLKFGDVRDLIGLLPVEILNSCRHLLAEIKKGESQ